MSYFDAILSKKQALESICSMLVKLILFRVKVFLKWKIEICQIENFFWRGKKRAKENELQLMNLLQQILLSHFVSFHGFPNRKEIIKLRCCYFYYVIFVNLRFSSSISVFMFLRITNLQISDYQIKSSSIRN